MSELGEVVVIGYPTLFVGAKENIFAVRMENPIKFKLQNTVVPRSKRSMAPPPPPPPSGEFCLYSQPTLTKLQRLLHCNDSRSFAKAIVTAVRVQLRVGDRTTLTFTSLLTGCQSSRLQSCFRRSLVAELQTVAPPVIIPSSVAKDSSALFAMNYFYPWDWTRDWMNSQNQWQPEVDNYKPPIIAKGQKEIPEWLRDHHQWEQAVDVNQLKKYQLKVKMCCAKCAEIVVEEIREVKGVFDVRAEQWENKVVVVAMPSGLDDHEVLMKARKVNRKAKFVDLDAKEKPKPAKKQQDGDNDKSEHGDNENKQNNNSKGGSKKQVQNNPSQANSTIVGQVVNWAPPRYLYPSHAPGLYPNPYSQFVHFV